jgi:hypothetical protein
MIEGFPGKWNHRRGRILVIHGVGRFNDFLCQPRGRRQVGQVIIVTWALVKGRIGAVFLMENLPAEPAEVSNLGIGEGHLRYPPALLVRPFTTTLSERRALLNLWRDEENKRVEQIATP